MIISFCGHSNYSSTQTDEIDTIKLLEEIIQGNQVDFYLGGYGNFDNFALVCAKKYKEKHSNAQIIFVTPYLGDWLDRRRDDLKKVYDDIIYPELEHVPKKFAISKRNEWIINQSDFIISYVKTHYGGAYKSLLYAHKRKKLYVNLYKGEYELY